MPGRPAPHPSPRASSRRRPLAATHRLGPRLGCRFSANGPSSTRSRAIHGSLTPDPPVEPTRPSTTSQPPVIAIVGLVQGPRSDLSKRLYLAPGILHQLWAFPGGHEQGADPVQHNVETSSSQLPPIRPAAVPRAETRFPRAVAVTVSTDASTMSCAGRRRRAAKRTKTLRGAADLLVQAGALPGQEPRAAPTTASARRSRSARARGRCSGRRSDHQPIDRTP